MEGQVKNFVIGALTSLVPIVGMSFYYDNMIKNEFDYATVIKVAPLAMGLLNTLVFYLWVEPNEITNFFLIGGVMAVVYTGYAHFFLEANKKVFELENENYFHFFSLVIWGLVYGVGVDYLYTSL